MELSRAGVGKHLGEICAKLRSVLPPDAHALQFQEVAGSGVVVNLWCNGFPSSRASKREGLTVPVVPLLAESETGPYYWLNVYQYWTERRIGRRGRFRYGGTTITVFYGNDKEDQKVQLLRAEWTGGEDVDGSVVLQPPGAGLPHWHFDGAVRNLAEMTVERNRLMELEQLLQGTAELEEFKLEADREAWLTDDLYRLCWERLTRVHFAQWAEWWKQPWTGDTLATSQHAMAPDNNEQVLNWIVSVVIYLRHELGSRRQEGMA